MAFQLATVLGFFLVSGAALLVFLLVGKMVRPRNPQPEKASTYECGERPFGPAWFNFNNRFYVIALVFVVFDVEVALVMPMAVVFRGLAEVGNGFLAFIELFLFLGILFTALIYVWAKGDLTWVRDIAAPTCKPVDLGRPKEED